MTGLNTDPQVAAIRAFNRFYTRRIGVVDEAASSPFTLAEARVLYELAHRHGSTATEIQNELGLDAGYMSRILRELERRKLLIRKRSDTDERQKALSLTANGRKAFGPLDQRSNRDVGRMIEKLSSAERKRLVDAMDTIHSLLGDRSDANATFLLRHHQPGDLGWIVHRQAIL